MQTYRVKLQRGARLAALAFALVATMLMGFCAGASAQESGTILGVVKDTSGGTIPQAKVTVVSAETSMTRAVTTGDDGAFRVSALRPGKYSVRIEKEGFNTSNSTDLNLAVGQELVLNGSLQVGTSAQEVTVTGEAPLVNTTTSSLGSLVNEERMSDLPLNGRNYVDLTLLQPGVAEQKNSGNGGAGVSGTWFSANGAPVRSNNYTIDGAPMVNAYGASTASEGGTTLGVDGIREYKIVTSAFSAEYGMTMGSQMVIVSKSGSNRWNGDVFEYLRNSALDARNFFDSPASSPGRRLPEFQRNNFGASFGGPIRRDKTFFYAVYEGLRQNLGVTVNDTVPVAACHDLVANGANFAFASAASATACGGLPANTVVPAVMKPFIDLFPTPTTTSANNNFTYPAASKQHVDFGQFRVDQNISAADTLFARYTIDDGYLNNATASTASVASGAAFPELFRITGASRSQFTSLGESHIINSRLLNSARVSFSRTSFNADNAYNVNVNAPAYSFVAGLPMGSVGITNYTTLGPNTGYPTFHTQNIYSAGDDVFYTKGRHAMKFGTLFNRYNQGTRHTKLLQGQLTFSDLPSFMKGIYKQYTSLTPGADLARDYIYNTLGFYAQDDVRVTSRLTLNAGLRYEFMTTPWELDHKESRFLNFTDPSQTWTFGPVMRNPTLKNFSPRLGFAWDIFGNGKTSLRSGVGWYGDVGNIGSALEQQPNGMPPYSGQSNVTQAANGAVVIRVPFVYTTANAQNNLQTMAYDVKEPHSLQFNMTVEQQLPGGIGLAVSYVGLRGRNLWHTGELNPDIPVIVNGVETWYPFTCNGVLSTVACTSGVQANNPAYHRINPNWGSTIITSTGSRSSYDSLQVVVNKRLSRGLQFQAAYTWSHAIDTTQGQMYASDCGASGGVQGVDPLNPAGDKGPSCFDVTHNLHFNLLYHLRDFKSDNFVVKKFLNGWWVGNIVSVQSGNPFTPVIGTNRSNSGVISTAGTDRPNLVTTASGNFVPYDKDTVITGNPNQWFNPNMFQLGPVGVLGNASRDMLRGPGLGTWNLSLNKDTAMPFLGEQGKLQFRVETFNLLNRANFALPNGTVFTGAVKNASEAPLASAGVISATSTTSRQIQLALKLLF